MTARLEPLVDVPLTAVELRALDLVADGLENAGIGVALGLSAGTVQKHVERIAAKLGAQDRAGIVVAAYLDLYLSRRFGTSGTAALRVSARQCEVLSLMAAGLSGEEIAVRLGVSVNTVKTHARKLFKALGARNRAHVIRLGVDAGLLRPVPDGVGPGGAA